MITLELHSPQPPSVVLNSLHAHAGEWRQSHIPEQLRREGVGAVESRIEGSRCTLKFRRRWYGPVERGVSLSAEATVYPDDTGTRVLLDIAYHHLVSPRLSTLLIGVVTAIGLALFGVLGLWFLVIGAASLTLQYSLVRGYNRDLTRARPIAAEYLLSQVKSAVAFAGQAPSSRMGSE
jgi:hypothetical protein